MLKHGNYIVNQEGGRDVNMLLFGMIGREIDGNQFARELEAISNMPDITACKIKINSVGGSVVQGYSILNAIDMLREKNIPVYTENVGVAYSIAGIIACYGDKGRRKINNFGTVMVHDPKFAFGNPDTDSKRQMLEKTTNALASIIENNTNLDAEQTKGYMTKETTFSADEALQYGFVDEIVQTGKLVQPISNHYDLMVACSDIYNNSINPKIKKMSKLALKLGLNAEASEDAMVNAVESLMVGQSNVQSLTDENASLKNQVELLTGEINNLKEENMTAQATDLIVNAVKEGKLTEAGKEVWIEKAKSDFDGIKNMIGTLSGVPKDVNADIENNVDQASVKELASKYEKMLDESPEMLDSLPEAEVTAMVNAFEQTAKLDFEVIQ